MGGPCWPGSPRGRKRPACRACTSTAVSPPNASTKASASPSLHRCHVGLIPAGSRKRTASIRRIHGVSRGNEPMKSRSLSAVCAALLVLSLGLQAQVPKGAASITPVELKEWLSYIASDQLQGRQVYTEGLG